MFSSDIQGILTLIALASGFALAGAFSVVAVKVFLKDSVNKGGVL